MVNAWSLYGQPRIRCFTIVPMGFYAMKTNLPRVEIYQILFHFKVRKPRYVSLLFWSPVVDLIAENARSKQSRVPVS